MTKTLNIDEIGPDVNDEVDGPLLGYTHIRTPIFCYDWDVANQSGKASVTIDRVDIHWEVLNNIVVAKFFELHPPEWW